MTSYTQLVNDTTVDRKLWEYLENINKQSELTAPGEQLQYSYVFHIMKQILDAGKVTDTEIATIKLASETLFQSMGTVSEGVNMLYKLLTL